MKKIKEFIISFIDGFCMALADSVPGVSGGTIAFLLGFYDNFINSLDDLLRGNLEAKKNALRYLIKLGIGWVIGFGISATILSNLFSTKVYLMSSLFIGFIIGAIPLVIRDEITSIKGKYKNIIFAIIGILVVVGISVVTQIGGLNVDTSNLNPLTALYVFVCAGVAITAMVLPGVSGSTLLLIFGLYAPIMDAIKNLLHFDFSVLPILIIFGLGILVGIVSFVKLVRICLAKYRSQTIYVIIGMMIGSLYAIVLGPTTIADANFEILNFSNFNILFFILGIIIIIGLELLKKVFNRE